MLWWTIASRQVTTCYLYEDTQQLVGKSPFDYDWFLLRLLWHGGQKHRMVIGSCSGVVKVHFCLDIFGRKLLFNRQRIWCFGLSLLLLLHWKRAGLLYVALHRGWLCLVWGLLFWQNWLDIDEELLSCTYLSRIFDTKLIKSRQFFG